MMMKSVVWACLLILGSSVHGKVLHFEIDEEEAVGTNVTMVKCPDGNYCPDENTCCKIASGGYGCCPLPKATCCPDLLHCCPSGMKCDSSGHCTGNGLRIPFFKKTPAIQGNVATKATEVKCPDGNYCPDENTCCKIASGGYGCCPLPKATCCPDLLHCCPSGMKCDSSGHCTGNGLRIPFFKKTPAIQGNVATEATEVSMVKCPDGNYCPDGNTCCKIASGGYGCCPLPKATCCPDLLHCCPSGMKCDSSGHCTGNGLRIPFFKKTPAIQGNVATKATEVKCPDGNYCPDENTCCKIASGGYGCCPLPKATCCPDLLHCCPSGMKCDTSGHCTGNGLRIPFFKKTPAIQGNVATKATEVKCPDGNYCPDENTCCKIASGGYGCCPLPKATCCPDLLHCCPSGMKCDTSGHCTGNGLRIPFFKKTPAIQGNVATKATEVKCPDGNYCPDENTCCKIASGGYGCCPLPKATCCPDLLHCCPSGMKCDTSGHCTGNGLRIPFFKKTPAIQGNVATKATEVKCPDGNYCPDGNTCCKIASGGYGCCPLPKATCCPDLLHCCPSGMKCDSSGHCTGNGLRIPFFKKTPAIPGKGNY